MLVATLQSLFKLILILSGIFGLAFMLMCTALVVVCIIHGDIRINIVRSETEDEKRSNATK